MDSWISESIQHMWHCPVLAGHKLFFPWFFSVICSFPIPTLVDHSFSCYATTTNQGGQRLSRASSKANEASRPHFLKLLAYAILEGSIPYSEDSTISSLLYCMSSQTIIGKCGHPTVERESQPPILLWQHISFLFFVFYHKVYFTDLWYKGEKSLKLSKVY